MLDQEEERREKLIYQASTFSGNTMFSPTEIQAHTSNSDSTLVATMTLKRDFAKTIFVTYTFGQEIVQK